MPGSMDGFGLAAWLKDQRPEIAVVLTWGHAQTEDAARDLCKHVGEIIRKPYDFRQCWIGWSMSFYTARAERAHAKLEIVATAGECRGTQRLLANLKQA